ncbi:MAG TPA: hypothetical protein VHM19_16950 [Polyangiales bacterium]|nr:hypothetical protein [Polyangiales bacterium]
MAVQIAFDFSAARTGGIPVPSPVLSRTAKPSVQPKLSLASTSEPPSIEAALRAQLDMALRVTFTDNRRTMISLRKRPGFTELRLHHMFLNADPITVRALGDYVSRADRNAATTLGRFIDAHRTRIKHRVARPITISTSGVHHDLCAIYADVNARFFEGKVDARITWGRDPGRSPSAARRSRRSIKLGSYCSRERLIRVHPALDAAFVPRFFVEYIVYHEMLHHVLPPEIKGGRRQLHDRRFKEQERRFPEYVAALRWERAHLDRLLRA